MKAFLAARSIFFVVLLPGTVAGYMPFQLLRSAGELRWPALSLSACLAALTALAGAMLLLASVWEFFAAGHGTLAPIDPPRQLVVSGLYRFTRNPMYNGVVGVLLGQAWFFSSLLLLEYAARWLSKPQERNYTAAMSYLSLLYDERTAATHVDKLKRARMSQYKAKDIFRALATLPQITLPGNCTL